MSQGSARLTCYLVLSGKGVWLKFSGGQGWWYLQNPPPLRTTFAFTHPCFKMFLDRSLNDLHHPTSSILHCYPPPHPPPLPPPLKILIIHKLLQHIKMQSLQSILLWWTGVVDGTTQNRGWVKAGIVRRERGLERVNTPAPPPRKF